MSAGSPNPFEEQLELVLSRPVQPVRLDREDFARFKARYRDERAIDDEKRLEYYVSTRWLEFSAGDIFVDIAAQDCPFASYIRQVYGCRAYRQDLYYLKAGIHGFDIGGDASNLPLPDGSVTRIALHNSFEHFEGDGDCRFIHQAQRVLAPGGKMCIVPLFVGEVYHEETDAGWIDAQGTKHPWGVGARFAREYDIATFKERVVDHATQFAITIYRVENAAEIADSAYLRYFAIFQKQ